MVLILGFFRGDLGTFSCQLWELFWAWAWGLRVWLCQRCFASREEAASIALRVPHEQPFRKDPGRGGRGSVHHMPYVYFSMQKDRGKLCPALDFLSHMDVGGGMAPLPLQPPNPHEMVTAD